MKRIGWIALLALAALLLCGAARAETEVEIAGDWYGTLLGRVMTLTLEEDGSYALLLPGSSQLGTWVLEGDYLVLDKGSDRETTMFYDGAAIILEDAVLTREPVAATEAALARQDTSLEEFQGVWHCSMISLFGDLLSVEEYGDTVVTVEGTRMTMTDSSGTQTYEGEFFNGSLRFLDLADPEDPVLLTLQLHEDGTLTLNVPFGDEVGIVFYLEAASADAAAEDE